MGLNHQNKKKHGNKFLIIMHLNDWNKKKHDEVIVIVCLNDQNKKKCDDEKLGSSSLSCPWDL
jgi:hypothetical protein